MTHKTNTRFALAAASALALLAAAQPALTQPPAAAKGAQGPSPLVKIVEDAQAKPTPRTADGKPDLVGLWRPPSLPSRAALREGNTIDLGFPEYGPGGQRPLPAGAPKYKPEHLQKVIYNDTNQPVTDKVFACGRPGVPRIGPPHGITALPGILMLYYNDLAGVNVRMVPIDGRPPRDYVDPSYNGESVGKWDGDTLVIESSNFVDETWIGERGYFHSDKLKVVERLSRKGDTLTWQFTAIDPEVLQEPWSPPARTVVLSKELPEEMPPCIETAAPHLVNMDNHGQR